MKIQLEMGDWYDAVYVDDVLLDPARSQAVFNHSPDGFAWGYGGSGPSQLALAILLAAGLPDDAAFLLHQDFKNEYVANWPRIPEATYETDVVTWAHDKLAANVRATQ